MIQINGIFLTVLLYIFLQFGIQFQCKFVMYECNTKSFYQMLKMFQTNVDDDSNNSVFFFSSLTFLLFNSSLLFSLFFSFNLTFVILFSFPMGDLWFFFFSSSFCSKFFVFFFYIQTWNVYMWMILYSAVVLFPLQLFLFRYFDDYSFFPCRLTLYLHFNASAKERKKESKRKRPGYIYFSRFDLIFL